VLVRVQSRAPKFKRSFGRPLPFQSSYNKKFFEARSQSHYTEVAELVDAHVSGACAARREGSSPSFGTVLLQKNAALCRVAFFFGTLTKEGREVNIRVRAECESGQSPVCCSCTRAASTLRRTYSEHSRFSYSAVAQVIYHPSFIIHPLSTSSSTQQAQGDVP
jgi:hypothetical protein